MHGGLSQDPIDIQQQEFIKRNYAMPPALGQKLLGAVFALASDKTRWTSNGIMFDVSQWQTQADKTTTSVKWDQLQHPLFHGGYFKLGEPWGNAGPMLDKTCDQWMDPSEPSNRAALLATGHLAIGYIYSDLAWAINRVWTDTMMKQLFDGTIEEVANKLIKNVPDLYLLARKSKTGAGRVFDAAKLKDLPDWECDGWVWDWEKYWDSHSNTINDFWLGLTADTTVRGAQFLSDNGYIPQQANVQAGYSSNWFVTDKGPVYFKNVLDRMDTIAAGYYYDIAKAGYINCNTLDDLITLLQKIAVESPTWKPYNIGAAVPGKVVLAYQILENITMPQVSNPTGGPSAIDVNSLNISQAAIYARYPKYAARRKAFESGTTPDPTTPTVDPNPAGPRTGKVIAQAGYINARTAPDASTDANIVEHVPTGTPLSWDSSKNVIDAKGNEFAEVTFKRFVCVKAASGTVLVKED
jgi:hypothetical protein